MRFFIWKRKRVVRRKKRTVSKKKAESARVLVHSKLLYFKQFYNFEYKKVFIRSQKTRWGSCSSKSNLNFNWRIIYLPPHLADYLIVHELCHLGEFNHSEKFWSLVEQTIPNYKDLRRELRKIDLNAIIQT